ncbi:cytochrome P450 [Flammula alnicola]|nr:cytochrome P450 [Flammula alnicola]
MTFYNYGAKWKEHRRVMHQNLNNRAVREWRQLQQDATTKFLKKMVVNPSDWLYRVEHLTGSAIMKFTYGYDLKEKDDYMPVVKKAIDALITSQGIGFMVDKLPILRYVPSWFPGARFKRFAEAGKKHCTQILEGPFKNTKDRWLAGNAAACYVTRLFEEFGGAEVPKEKEQVIKETSAVLYAAGTDSTYSIFSSFFLASTLFPNVYKAAREEIDRVVGTGRLPTFTDREELPYIDALVKEVLRWNPAAPLSPSHQILVDDEYDGYLIPAGTIIHPNIWSMTHNDEMYPNPFDFKPERFLGLSEERAKEIDPRNFIFGFGRRVCVGQFFADQQIWLVIASLIATFDIRKAKDEFGKEITPVPNYPSFVGKPDPFPCVVTLRGSNAARLIEEATIES